MYKKEEEDDEMFWQREKLKEKYIEKKKSIVLGVDRETLRLHREGRMQEE
jgi:hypothetical protein